MKLIAGLGLTAVGLLNSPQEYAAASQTEFQKRFWSMVGGVGDLCWIWQGRLNPDGYGQVSFNGGAYSVHVVAYLLTHGPIRDGLWVLHTCDNRSCCNPSHLYEGTRQQNQRDMIKRKRHHGNVKTTDKGLAL